MKHVSRGSWLLALALAAACGSAAKTPQQSPQEPEPTDKVVPLIDRTLFFGDPVITAAQLSPDGQYLAFIKPYKDVRNVWVKRIHEDFDQARPLTADQRPVINYFWSRDSRYVLYIQDKGGNENFHVYAVDPAAAPAAETGVPPARDLTDIEGVRAQILSVPRTDPDSIIIGLNNRDPAYHDVYRLSLSTGERKLLIENTQKVASYVFDNEGNVRLAMRQNPDGSMELMRVDGKELVSIYTTTYEEQAFPIQFHANGEQVYLQTNKGPDVDLVQLMLLDPKTGKTELVDSDPEREVDFGGALFSDETDELLATFYVGDRLRIYPKNEQMRRDLEVLRAKFPDQELSLDSTTKDLRLWTVSVSSDVDPGSTYLYERDSGKITLLYRSRPDLPSEHLAPMKPVRYQARDGLTIPGYLVVPRGVEARNLPVVVNPHGGPWGRDTWGYDAYAQFLANRGYAVFQPNFRSSSGYGKKFLNAGNRQWGTGAMQHDISDGVKWLIDQGIADPKRICIFGGSYGGYATLAGVTFTPELYACGIPYVAPSNMITLIESFPAYWRPFLAGTWLTRVGDPTVEADRKDLEARSPINFVDRIRVPLLVVHGANDPRVTQIESDQIVTALRDKGQAVEYVVAPDEGHGFRAPANRLAMAVAMERFLAKHLGGRQQEDVPADIARRLAEITVDVSKVEKPDPKAKAQLAAAMAAPLPEAKGSVIKPAKLEYALTVKRGPQSMTLKMGSVIEAPKPKNKKERAVWRITDTAETPMGKALDTFDVDKATLKPVRRTLGGMITGELQYSDTAVKGKVSVLGQSSDVDIALQAPVFGDGPNQSLVIAGLPLAEGYQTTLRRLSVETQKVEAYHLAVTGVESTTVPAGTFETFVVELKPLGDAAGGVLRVLRKAPHYVVKAEYQLPAATGGGTMSMELTSSK